MSKSEQMKAMKELQELAFALQETVLFLDSYPDNSAAKRHYAEVSRAYRQAVASYERQYGPLSVMAGTDSNMDTWQWVKTPWPWELGFPTDSDVGGEV